MIEGLGYTATFEEYRKAAGLDSFKVGRIISQHKERFNIKSAIGEFDAELIGNLRFSATDRYDLPAVGDWVAFSEYDEGKALIHAVFPAYINY
jgi:ribosome biogenesis GTPase